MRASKRMCGIAQLSTTQPATRLPLLMSDCMSIVPSIAGGADVPRKELMGL
jgi:hypothetical protein